VEKRSLEQRCATKFCIKLNENATETYEKLKEAYGEHAVSRAQVVPQSVEDEPRSGRPCTSKTDENMTKLRALMRCDRRLTARMIASELNLNHQSIHNILTEKLSMRTICAKLFPKNLANEQKENRRNVCLDLIERIENDEHFFKDVITGDESWVLQ
jgi:hypothetical protein